MASRPATPRLPRPTASRSSATRSASSRALDLQPRAHRGGANVGDARVDRRRRSCHNGVAQSTGAATTRRPAARPGRSDRESLEAFAPGTRRTRRSAAWRRCLRHQLLDVVLGLVVAHQIAARRSSRTGAGLASNSSERSTSSPNWNTNMRARCLSTSSTPKRSSSCTSASSWPIAGALLITTRLDTDTGSGITSNRVVRRAREDGEPTRLRSVEDDRARSARSARSPPRSRRVPVVAHRPQQMVELGLDVLATHMVTTIHIEITGDNWCTTTSEPGQLADGVLGDRRHSTSVSPPTGGGSGRDGTPTVVTALRGPAVHGIGTLCP